MCLAIPAKILEIMPDCQELARVEVSGVRRQIHVGLLAGEVGPGDWVLIHVGFALSKIDEEEARRTLENLETLSAYREEFEGLHEVD